MSQIGKSNFSLEEFNFVTKQIEQETRFWFFNLIEDKYTENFKFIF